MTPQLPTLMANDPPWWSDLKRWCLDMIAYADSLRVVGDNRTIRISNGIVSALFESAFFMFQVASFAASTITIRCGVCATWCGGIEYDAPTVRGAGNSWDPNNTVDVTSISASTWIIGTVDDADHPTTVTLSATGSTAYPASNNNLTVPIALVTVAGGVITNYYQAHSGPWFRFRGGGASPDNTSTELCPALNPGGQPSARAGLLQEYGYDDAAGAHAGTPGMTSRHPFIPGITNNEPAAQQWCSLVDLLDNCDWDDAINFTNWLVQFIAGNMPTLKHTDLSPNDSTPGKLGLNSDHDQRHDVKGAGWTPSGTEAALRIANNFMAALGRDYNNLAIDLANSQLYNAAGTLVTLDWAALSLKGDWSTTGTTDATNKTTAAFKTAGGLACALSLWCGATIHADTGFQIDASNKWDLANGFSAVTSSPMLIQGGTTTLRTGPAGAAFKTSVSGLELDSAGGTITINGNAYTEQLVSVDINGTPTPRYILARTP